jgi:asparagine synthase (glutamine-hydrolysing)
MGVVAGSVRLTDGVASFAVGTPWQARGNISIALDASLLNVPELARELQRSPSPPRDPDAADVIAAGYRTWGDQMFSRLRGSFAIALWDAERRVLLLARDRAGVKSMHFTVAEGQLFFASDTATLLANSAVDREIDSAALDHYLAFLLTPRDRSIVRGIRKVLPGHIVRLQNGVVSMQQYWRLPLQNDFHGTEDEAVSRLDELLQDAVARQLAQDDATGVLLSGGVRSSLVAAIASRVSSGPIRTLALGVGETNAADVEAARTVAKHLGTDHREVIVRPDVTDVLDRVLPSLDEPFADASVIPMWYLARSARTHVPAVLSGDGEEVFGGCDRYLPPSRVAAFDRVTGRAGRAFAGLAARLLPDSAPGRHFIRHVSLSDRARYLEAMCFCAPGARRNLVSRDAWPVEEEAAEAMFGAPFSYLAHLPWPAQMMAFDFQVELPEDILMPRGRTAITHGLACYAPMLDHHIVELAAALPVSMKIRGRRLKHILRAVASRYLPAPIVERPSYGFGLSPASWISSDVFADILRSPVARQRGYLNQPAVDILLREHLEGTKNHAQLLWALVVLEQWQQSVGRAPSAVGALVASS